MRAEIFPYYERALHQVRRQAAEFARQHRGAAEKLLLNPDSTGPCKDPHVERLIEAFAYLTAGIDLRLEDDFVELAGALLEIVAPHLLAPVPSISIVRLDPAKIDRPVFVPAGAELFTRPLGSLACRFRTAYPVTIWPIDVSRPVIELPRGLGALPGGAEAFAVLRAELTSRAGPLPGLLHAAAAPAEEDPDRSAVLRFYLDGGEQFGCYDLIFGHTTEVYLRDPGTGAAHRVGLRPAGLDPRELLWSRGPSSLTCYGLLQEYFACPKKFLFFDLVIPEAARAGLGTRAEVIFLLDRHPGAERTFSTVHLRLSCTPAVNLFAHEAEAIDLNHQRSDYLVEPDAGDREAYEVFSVEKVGASDGRGELLPLYSQRHLSGAAWGSAIGSGRLGDEPGPLGYYLAERRSPSLPARTRTDVYLSFVDLGLRQRQPATQRLRVRTLCTNGDFPQHAGADPGFTLNSGGAAAVAAIRTLEPPTRTRRPQLSRGMAWRLVSHLSLNYLSLGDHQSDGRAEAAVDALRELLLLHAAHAAPEVDGPLTQQVLGLVGVETRPTVACPRGMAGPCRGLQVTIKLDSPNYQGTSQILFASVLERFLGRYVSINSFTQMVAKDRHDRTLKAWKPRAGDRVLL